MADRERRRRESAVLNGLRDLRIELAVLASGWVLGGTVGIGTVVYALGIGPLAHIFIPLLRIQGRTVGVQPPDPDTESDA